MLSQGTRSVVAVVRSGSSLVIGCVVAMIVVALVVVG
jgi:hypothetical protein